MLFMGGCSIFGGLLALLLPETLGQPLVESIEDVDLMGPRKSFFSWWSKEKLEERTEHNRRIYEERTAGRRTGYGAVVDNEAFEKEAP